jgi:hypothetical protein
MKPINGAAWTGTMESTAKVRAGRWPSPVASFVLWLATAIAGPAGPADAACLQSGSTVTCSGASNTGFGTGAENNLTLTVQPDGSITVGHLTVAVDLNDGNTVINNGAISVGTDSKAIQGGANNTFTNNGSMTIGSSSIGIFVTGNNNVVSNTGTISATFGSIGLDVLGAGSTATIPAPST